MKLNVFSGSVLLMLALSVITLKAQSSSVEYDDFRGTSLDTSKWTSTGASFSLITDPSDSTDKIARWSGANIADTGPSVNRNLSRVNGAQILARANCSSYYTNEMGTIGINMVYGAWEFWMQINGESISGVDGPTIEMVWVNNNTGATDFQRDRISWDTWYELRIYVDAATSTVNFYHITPDQNFSAPNFSYNYSGTLPTAPSSIVIDRSVNNGDYVELDEVRLLVDLQDVTVSSATPYVPEGGTKTVTVTFPSNHPCDMPITVTAGAGDTNLTISPMSFTLTPTANTQELTITAAEDPDDVNGSRVFDLDPYGTINHATITATELDNEKAQAIIVLTPDSTQVIEGLTSQVAVSLNDYSADALITVTSAGTDSDLTVSPSSFTLSSGTPTELLTITAAEDLDQLNGSETFTLSSEGLTNVTLTATEVDNDILRILVTPGTIPTLEGKSNDKAAIVQLSKDPGTPVTLSIARTAGDTDITSVTSITLDSTNYGALTNYITITAAEDDSDTENDTATFTIAGAGIDEDATFEATVVDDDITLTINKTGSGSVKGDGIHDLDDDIPFVITAIPTFGESFIRWSGPDADKVEDTTKMVTAIVTLEDAEITAEFSVDDDDDSSCTVGTGSFGSLLPIILLLAGMAVSRFRRK